MIYKVKCQTFADSRFSNVRHCYYFLFYIILFWKFGRFDLLKTSMRGAGICDQHKKPNRFIFEYIYNRTNVYSVFVAPLTENGRLQDNSRTTHFIKKQKRQKEVEEIMKSKRQMHSAAAPGGLLSSHPLMLKLWCWLSFLFQLYFFSQKLDVQKKSELWNKRTDYPCVAHYSLLWSASIFYNCEFSSKNAKYLHVPASQVSPAVSPS